MATRLTALQDDVCIYCLLLISQRNLLLVRPAASFIRKVQDLYVAEVSGTAHQ